MDGVHNTAPLQKALKGVTHKIHPPLASDDKSRELDELRERYERAEAKGAHLWARARAEPDEARRYACRRGAAHVTNARADADAGGGGGRLEEGVVGS